MSRLNQPVIPCDSSRFEEVLKQAERMFQFRMGRAPHIILISISSILKYHGYSTSLIYWK